MKRVYATRDQAVISILRDILYEHGIETTVLNESTAAAMGDIPFFYATPEVWIHDDSQLDAAKRVVRAFDAGAYKQSDSGTSWTCPRCGEHISGQFSECWHCAGDAPTGEPADPMSENDD